MYKICESKESEYRIKTQLQEVKKKQFPFAIRISQKQNRTVIFALVFPLETKNRVALQLQKPAKVYFHHQEKWEENQDKIEHSLQSKDNVEFTFQRNEDDQINNQAIFYEYQKPLNQKQICFGIFIHHNMYPYQSPYITICNQCIFPGACDFKDYFYDIMEISTWWPSIKLKDILLKLPGFAFKLQSCYEENRILRQVGTFQYNFPLYLQDIKQNAKYFYSINCKVKFKRQFKKNVLIAITSQYLLILKQTKERDAYLIDKKIKREEIAQIICTNNKQNELFQIRMNNSLTIYVKIKKEATTISSQSCSLLKFYIKYFLLTKLMQQVSGQNKIEILETMNQFIQLADLCNHVEAIQWAKTQSKYILQSFYDI